MLRHISKVECCNSIHLAQVISSIEHRIALCQTYIPFIEIETVGLSSLTSEEDVSNGTRIHKNTLKATLCSYLIQNESNAEQPLAFRLTDVEGRQYLLGNINRPYPLVTQSLSCPDKSNEKSVITLTVEMQGNMPLLEIITS